MLLREVSSNYEVRTSERKERNQISPSVFTHYTENSSLVNALKDQ